MPVGLLARQIYPRQLTNVLRRENGEFVPLPAMARLPLRPGDNDRYLAKTVRVLNPL